MNLFHIMPFLVVLFEYTAISSSLAYAEHAADYVPPIVGLLGGIISVGGNLPYQSVPHMVMILHLLALTVSVIYLVYFMFFSPAKFEQQE